MSLDATLIFKMSQHINMLIGSICENVRAQDLNGYCQDIKALSQFFKDNHLNNPGLGLKDMIDLDNLRFDQVFHDIMGEGIKMNAVYLSSNNGSSRPPIERWRQIQRSARINLQAREYILALKSYKGFIEKAIEYELARPRHTLPLYWAAVKHGCLEHVLDLHEQANRHFPVEVLMIEKTKHKVNAFDLLPFTGEAHLYPRLLSPQIWGHKRELFKEFYHTRMPPHVKAQYPYQECDRALIEYGLNKTPRTFGHSIKKRM